MHCPYCFSEINPKALVCSVCRRDLYLFKPLLLKINELETQLKLLEAKQLAPDCALTEEGPEYSKPTYKRSWVRTLAYLIMPLIVMVIGHLLLNFIYDTKTVYLRLLALIAPVPFGYLFLRSSRFEFWQSLIAAFVMAALSVLAMSWVTHLFDDVPIMPQNVLDTREAIEFSTSIALSFITGIWLALWQERRAVTLENAKQISALAASSGLQVKESLTSLNDLGSAVVAFATTAFSIYTGLKHFL
jgi:hypothetical protein